MLWFGIDFDGTYSSAPDVFRQFVVACRAAGYDCVLVTNRGPQDAVFVENFIGHLMPVVYCNGQPKRACAHAAGYPVDIWIDDNPVLVDFGQAGLGMVGYEH